MAEKSKDLQVREKQELDTQAEQTRPGLVFKPAVDIFESEDRITVLADVPGVPADGVNIDLREGVLTITADVKADVSAEEQLVMTEFETGRYYRRFTLSDVIDQQRIEAKLEDGVLRLVLPKAEKALPRKIQVAAA